MAGKAVQKASVDLPGPPDDRQIPITARFRLVFLTTVILTFVFLACSMILAARGDDSAIAREVASACLSLTKIGFGAIVGLLGGKSL